MNVKKLVTYSDIFPSAPAVTLQRLHELLKECPRQPMLSLCATLNACLKGWTGKQDFSAHDQFVKQLFPQSISDRLLGPMGVSSDVVFHRQQLLLVAKESARMGHLAPLSGELPPSVWKVFLAANDLLYVEQPHAFQRKEQALKLLASMIPIVEACGFTNYQHRLARAYSMIFESAPKLAGIRVFKDLPALFQTVTGLPLNVYMCLIFCVMAKYRNFDFRIAQSDPDQFILNSNEWFKNVAIPADQIKLFMSMLSAEIDDFATLPGYDDTLINDFTLFKDRPLLCRESRFAPIDFSLLGEKFENGPFWTVFLSLDKKNREELTSFWGYIFEQYVNDLLESSLDLQSDRLTLNARYADDDTQVCDALVRSGDTLILIESKGNIFPKAKYSGTWPEIGKLVDRNLASDKDGSKTRKGVFQLAHSITSIFNRVSPRAIRDVDLKGITTVYPVLVVRDEIAEAPGFNTYLNCRFREAMAALPKPRQTVTPLYTISSQELEFMTGYLQDRPMFELLRDRWKAGQGLWCPVSMLSPPPSYVRELGIRRPPVYDRLRNRIKSDLIPLTGLSGDIPEE